MTIKPTVRSRRLLVAAVVGICAVGVSVATSTQCSAHEGPPFSLVMDQSLAGYSVSIWADPDIGEASFFIILETSQGERPEILPNVSVWVEPVNGRLERATYIAERDSVSSQVQFVAYPHLDKRDIWNLGVVLTNADGTSEDWTTEIESTPPGYFGIWDVAIYVFPFVLIGVLWVLAMVRRRRAMHMWAEENAMETMGAEDPSGEHQTNDHSRRD